MPNTSAATALSVRGHNLRTRVRVLRTLLVFVALSVGFPLVVPQPAQAVPMPEVATSWIASTSRGIALELRASRSLPESEQRAIAGRQINEVAGLVAYILSADAEALRSVWAATSLTRKIAMFTALSQLGVPYRLNADAPFVALDCSALTKFAWAQAGLDIERGSQYQFARAARIAQDDVQAGDLVWYPGHIMLSLGLPELIVHARSGQRAVEIHRIDSTRLSWMRWVSPLQ